MSWPELMEPELQAYVEERQATALRTYENDPDLLTEHVRQEDSFRSGGYGTRQISELLQNAVDALGAAGGTGMVELRLADGALYCANEGAAFTKDGLRAVTYAFLSTKRGDEIGRFGLGFKSILGITDHPQIYSKSVSFEFNAPDTAELFAGVPREGGRLPLLRIPTLAQLPQAATDPNLAELMSWATTVVKLPLIREGDRLRRELLDFNVEALLFFKPLERLRISVQQSPGAAPEARDYIRVGHPDDGEVHLTAPGRESERWLYAEREYRPTIDVASTLPQTAHREVMKVSYAVRPEGRAGVGRLWAWFPLNDETTASGVFNAPWQVNDDRTSLVPGSLLNRAMLGVAADLFLDVVTRASTSVDAGAHLDLFPARGRESRSNADTFLSEEIPRRASVRPMIPDVTAELKVPSYFERVPDLQKTPLSPGAARAWQERAPRSTMPHWQCFTTSARRLRLRTLLGGSDGERSPREAPVGVWLEELAKRRDYRQIEAAVSIAAALVPISAEMKDAVGAAAIVPLGGGGWARVGSNASVLLPLEGAAVPDGVKTVDSDFTAFGTIADDLRSLGFRVVSADETALALSHEANDRWSGAEWQRFWTVVSAATQQVATTAIEDIRKRGVDVLLPTKADTWRSAWEVIADPGFAPGLLSRHVDSQKVPSVALVRAAGAIEAPKRGYPLERDALRPQYVSAIESMARAFLAREGYKGVRVVVPDAEGVGPLAVLQEELSDTERVFWTRAVLRSMLTREIILKVRVGAKVAEIPASSFEWWAARHFGCMITTLGPKTLTDTVSSRLAQFGAYLPVAADAELSGIAGLPVDVADVSDSNLGDFLSREGYAVASTGTDAFVELLRVCAGRESLATPELMPAIVRGTVVLAPVSEVAVTEKASDIAALDEAGVAYVPTHGKHGELVAGWGLLMPGDALQQSLEVIGVGQASPLLDIYPSLQSRVLAQLAKQKLARAESIARVLQSLHGVTKRRLLAGKQDGVIVVDASLDDEGVLEQISRALDLGLSTDDIRGVLRDDEGMRRSELIERAQLAKTNEARLLILVGADTLRQRLPKGLLPAVESRTGALNDREMAELFLQVQGQDAVRALRDDLARAGIPVPKQWDGSPSAQSAVKRLGFDTSYAGSREVRRASVTQVQGQILLNELHDFQQALALQIAELATTRDPAKKRGLLYLPTGAGKTRVTVEALLHLLKDGKVEAPLLWIAQSEELCEQAITAFAEVWRWMGDERPLDVSRFWSGHELDESNEELQIVVAIDDTLVSRLNEPQYGWLTQPGLVVIDEAHTAGTKTYTEILRSLGLTASRTDRPLLGLTATPFRGRNEELNRRFVDRFGANRLESLDPEDPIGELRQRQVLSEVDYDLLSGVSVAVTEQDAEFRRMKEVTKNMLTMIGQDMGRTQGVVDHIQRLLTKNPDWPVLVFAASVASAHTIAALLRLQNVRADSVDGGVRKNQRRRVVERFKSGESQVLVNCDLLTQGFDAPKVRALYIARPTFSPNRYLQMVGRGLRGPANGGTERCLIVNVADTFEQFGEELAYNEFDYLWSK